jgi:WG containing repeat
LRLLASVMLSLSLSAAAYAADSLDCSSGTPMPFVSNGKTGYLTSSGITIPPVFDSGGRFFGNTAVACVAGKCGSIDRNGVFVSPLRDKNEPIADRYSEGLGPAPHDHSASTKWGYLDAAGNVVIPFRYMYAGDFIDGMARVRLGDRFFFVDHGGNQVTPEFEAVFDFSEELAAVIVNGKGGYILRDGSFAIPPAYEGVNGFSEGLAAVRIRRKLGYIDKSGAVVIKPEYDFAYPFNEGLAAVAKTTMSGSEVWGYIDKTGQQIIPLQFAIGHTFQDGVASVQTGNKWGYVDHSGSFVIPPVFGSAMPFCAGLAQVETFTEIHADAKQFQRRSKYTGKRGLIDHSGRYVWRDQQEQVRYSPFVF